MGKAGKKKAESKSSFFDVPLADIVFTLAAKMRQVCRFLLPWWFQDFLMSDPTPQLKSAKFYLGHPKLTLDIAWESQFWCSQRWVRKFAVSCHRCRNRPADVFDVKDVTSCVGIYWFCISNLTQSSGIECVFSQKMDEHFVKFFSEFSPTHMAKTPWVAKSLFHQAIAGTTRSTSPFWTTSSAKRSMGTQQVRDGLFFHQKSWRVKKSCFLHEKTDQIIKKADQSVKKKNSELNKSQFLEDHKSWKLWVRWWRSRRWSGQ